MAGVGGPGGAVEEFELAGKAAEIAREAGALLREFYKQGSLPSTRATWTW